MKKFIYPLVFIFLILNTCLSQTDSDKKKAHNLGKQAIKLEEKEGKYDEAITLFKQAQQLDPENIDYPYEIAYAFYLKKDYAASIELSNNLLNHKDVKDEVYRLLGTSYDMTGNPEKALEIYNNGLTVFPNSGKLYHEIGILYANIDSAEPAIENWELGIKADPTFASNYYELTKVFCNSTERVWGVLYGELFLNLERNSDRSYEISKLLYDTYKNAITIHIEKDIKMTGQISFTMVFIADSTQVFQHFANLFELTILKSIGNTKKISLKGLNSIRNSYIATWYKLKSNERFPNILFDWHKYLINKGYFEAYNYWIFNNGNVSEFEKWGKDNYDEFKEFAQWFTANPLQIDKNHYFVRTQY
jgi:tetratricopeptide (TPR) repeat protein